MDCRWEYKLLFFGFVCGKTQGAREVLPEAKLDCVLTEFGSGGWRLVHISYDPGHIVEQWRVVLEREVGFRD